MNALDLYRAWLQDTRNKLSALPLGSAYPAEPDEVVMTLMDCVQDKISDLHDALTAIAAG
jgi:hypothetical protein